jgi:hypothetical protein
MSSAVTYMAYTWQPPRTVSLNTHTHTRREREREIPRIAAVVHMNRAWLLPHEQQGFGQDLPSYVKNAVPSEPPSCQCRTRNRALSWGIVSVGSTAAHQTRRGEVRLHPQVCLLHPVTGSVQSAQETFNSWAERDSTSSTGTI